MGSAPEWYYETESGITGPLSSAELRELIEEGRVERTVVRIRKGEDGPWLPAERIRPMLDMVGENETGSDVINEPVEWYFSGGDGRKIGPVSWKELAAMRSQGGLQPDGVIWKPGMAAWIPVSERPEVLGEGSTLIETKMVQRTGPNGRWFHSHVVYYFVT